MSDKQTVRIVTPQPERPDEILCAFGTKVFLGEDEIPHISKITISPMHAESILTAEIEIAVAIADIHAHPLLGLDTLREAARIHGYWLVRDEETIENEADSWRTDPE